jgi:hypothetical protein
MLNGPAQSTRAAEGTVWSSGIDRKVRAGRTLNQEVRFAVEVEAI